MMKRLGAVTPGYGHARRWVMTPYGDNCVTQCRVSTEYTANECVRTSTHLVWCQHPDDDDDEGRCPTS